MNTMLFGSRIACKQAVQCESSMMYRALFTVRKLWSGPNGRKKKQEAGGEKEERTKEAKRSERRRARRWKKQRKVDRGLAVVATVKVELTPSCHV